MYLKTPPAPNNGGAGADFIRPIPPLLGARGDSFRVLKSILTERFMFIRSIVPIIPSSFTFVLIIAVYGMPVQGVRCDAINSRQHDFGFMNAVAEIV